jgi:hypothetical protein
VAIIVAWSGGFGCAMVARRLKEPAAGWMLLLNGVFVGFLLFSILSWWVYRNTVPPG